MTQGIEGSEFAKMGGRDVIGRDLNLGSGCDTCLYYQRSNYAGVQKIFFAVVFSMIVTGICSVGVSWVVHQSITEAIAQDNGLSLEEKTFIIEKDRALVDQIVGIIEDKYQEKQDG